MKKNLFLLLAMAAIEASRKPVVFTHAIPKSLCDHLPGSLAGAFQTILDHEEKGIRVVGREIKCASNGDTWCEFIVEPE